MNSPNEPPIPPKDFSFMVQWPISATYPPSILQGSGTATDPYYVVSPGPNPYTEGTPYPGTPVPAGFVVRHRKPDGFQILSPGIIPPPGNTEVGYGHGGQFPFDETLPGNRDDNDNLTNFFGAKLEHGSRLK